MRKKKCLTVAFISAVIMLLVLVSTPAQAVCVTPKEEGNWTNADFNTNGITRIYVRFVCQDLILNGQPSPPGSSFYVHLWGSCTPNDCDWGEVGADRDSEGWIRATYDHGFVTETVQIKMDFNTVSNTSMLRLKMRNDFKDPNRPDYDDDEWFVPKKPLVIPFVSVIFTLSALLLAWHWKKEKS